METAYSKGNEQIRRLFQAIIAAPATLLNNSCCLRGTTVADTKVESGVPVKSLNNDEDSLPKTATFPIADGGISLDDFTIRCTVGKGSFSQVYLVTKKDTGAVYAMKVVMKDTLTCGKRIQYALAERLILEDIDHPFIVSLRFAFQTETKLCLVFDYFNGGDLEMLLRTQKLFSVERSRVYAAEVALAVEYLHRRNILFRDLKPENLLLCADGHIRLTDFGLSRLDVTGSQGASSFVGTRDYLAPEVVRRQRYGKAVDWWCFGILLFRLVSGFTPFHGSNVKEASEKILNDPLVFPDDFPEDESLRDLLNRLLDKNPTTRIIASQVKSHPFFSAIDWGQLQAKENIPKFKPVVTSSSDTDNISHKFTSMPVELVSSGEVDPSVVDPNFPDFDFVHPSLREDATTMPPPSKLSCDGSSPGSDCGDEAGTGSPQPPSPTASLGSSYYELMSRRASVAHTASISSITAPQRDSTAGRGGFGVHRGPRVEQQQKSKKRNVVGAPRAASLRDFGRDAVAESGVKSISMKSISIQDPASMQ